MKRTNHFVQSRGVVTCRLATGEEVEVPVVPGLLKHPTLDQLREMLKDPDVVKKYTVAALCKASWPVLRQFQRAWLRECIAEADLDPRRRRALEFLIS